MQFRVLGPLEAEGEAGLVALGGPKERAALAMLVLRAGEVVSAEFLIDALWGDDPPRTAAKTLQTYIFRIRRSLAAVGDGDVLATHGAGYRLCARHEDVDAARFERLLAAGRKAAARSDHDGALGCLDQALALWRGKPLAELSFSDVLSAESTRLSELHLGAVEQRVGVALAAGHHQELVGELRQRVSEHPLREALWESLMLALYRCGRQADALRTYQDYRALLIDELGIEPGPGLKELERRILEQDPELVIGAATSVRGPRDRRPDAPATGDHSLPSALQRAAAAPLVGRQSERERLQAARSRARGGGCEAVLISGEPGIGKTALAAAVAAEAHASGAIVLYGRCDEGAIVPYQPFVEALRHYVAHAPLPVLRDHLAATGGELARLLPDLRRRLPELEEQERTGEAHSGERHVLFDAVASLLAEASRHHPVLLVLDDLHWADQATLLLLRHLLGSSDAGSLLVVATYRDTDLGRTHPLAETLAILRRQHPVERIALAGLDGQEVATMVAEVLGVTADEGRGDLAHRIAEETAGNPLFVREVLLHLAESGRTTAGGETLVVPEGVHEVIGRRLARLSDEANSALAVAAVVGTRFEIGIVAGASEIDEPHVVSALEEAGAAGLVREVGSSGEIYEFSHAVVRRGLYEELSASRRVRTHRRVAGVLESLEQRRPGTRVAELAHHLAEAAQREDVERAISYCRRAGDAALDQLAYEEAARYFRRALEMLDLHESPSEARRAELLLALGDAVARVDVPASLEIILDAAAAARRAGDVQALAQAAIALVGPRGSMQEPGREDRLLDEALAAVPEDDPLVVRLLAARAQWLAQVAPTEVLSPMTRRAMGLARRLGDPSLLVAAAVGRLFALTEADDAEERLSLANEVLRAGDACPPGVTAIALRNRAHALFERGSYCEAWESVDEHRRLVERFRNPMGLSLAAVLDAMRASIEGRLDDAEALVTRSIELTRLALQDEVATAMNLPSLFPIRWLQGRLPELDEPSRRVASAAPHWHVASTGLAAAVAASGRTEEARALLADAVPGPYADIPRNRMWSFIAFHLAVIQPFLNDAARAGELYALLEPYEDREWVAIGRYYQGCFAHQLGILAGITGEADLAVSHLNHARARYQKLGSPPWLARAEQDLAEVLLCRDRPGDRKSAAGLLASAGPTAERLGMLGIARSNTTRRRARRPC
ncbi:MAG TPA: BTAD domain-containing putative transcriptional regulator [Acidimicrobiales bacterium]|nr:BTAD domain-containing putative transcriptional regulator [Acidimicrobiales bacterium]